MKIATLFIKDLILSCIIGNDKYGQRSYKRKLCLQISLWTDISKATKSDALDDAVDIIPLYKEIVTKIENSTFNLIESLADMIAEICLKDPKIQKVKIVIEKIGLLEKAERSGIELTIKK